MDWSKKIILLTGGTGSFGQKFTEIMLKKYKPKVLRIYSRDELKQSEMRIRFHSHPSLRYFVGDVRDRERLYRAMDRVNIVVHAAALKQVPSCEYNPFEAVKTNILGAENIIDVAIDKKVEKVITVSTDKAVNPVNLYGATKMCAEKIFVSANAYKGWEGTRISCVRYGNVVGSRGSVIPLFKRQREKGRVTVTDSRMTRFWIELGEGAEFVIQCVQKMHGGEIFVPKIPSMKIMDLVKVMAPKSRVEFVGIRPGEKIHECLLTEDEARHSREFDRFFVIEPEQPWWNYKPWKGGKRLTDGFRYTSDKNRSWLTVPQLQKMVKER